MQKKKDTIRLWMPGVMITSLVLLTVFVGHWLNSQYELVQTRVERDVRADLKRTSDQLVDTMMLGLMEKPLKDANIHWSSSSTISHIGEGDEQITEVKQIDSLKNGAMIKIMVQTDSSLQGKHSYHRVISQKDRKSGKLKVKTIDHKSDKIVVISNKKQVVPDSELKGLFTKGLGVFVKELASIKDMGNVSAITNQELDTHLYKQLLQENWQQEGLLFQPLISDQKEMKPTPLNNVIFATAPVFSQHIGVRLNNVSPFIFGQLLPQIAFALFLIVITSGGFIFIYRSWRKQVQLNQLRLDFVHNMSHELKTPVSTVKVAVEALQLYNRRDDPKVMDEYLTVIQHEMNRLDNLVNNVLSNAMMQGNQTVLHKERTDLVPLVQAVVQRMEVSFRQAEINYFFNSENDHLYAEIDAFHIEGVLINLLDNCVKYAGRNSEVRVNLNKMQNTAVIEVEDNGPGISTEYIGQLFDPFFRVPTGNEHAVKGYGLGLSYCNQVMKQHNGTIRVQHGVPKGVCFHLSFPLAR